MCLHDERIGVGNVHHLFRLPEDLEQDILGVIMGDTVDQIAQITRSAESARQWLIEASGSDRQHSEGPVRIGSIGVIHQLSSWADVAACYLTSFDRGIPTFPFFSDL